MSVKRTITVKLNGWAALKDIMIHSMDKGQFPLAIVGAIVGLIIWCLEPKDVSRLLDRILYNLTTLKGVSYLANIGLIVAWYIHAKWQRRSISIEMNRMGREKTRLQEHHTDTKLASTNPKKKRGDE